MLKDGTWTYTWEHGRELASMSIGTDIAIKKQPVDFTGRVGDNATFTVEASGSGLSYQWQVSTNGGSTWGNSAAGGYSTNSMWVTITESNGGRLYRCKVTDSSGNIRYSEPGRILSVPIVITAQPDDFFGSAGATATFSVTAAGNGLSYQWQVSTNGGSTWGDSTAGGYATASMWVTITSSNIGRLYRCKITDSSGNVTYSQPGKIRNDPVAVTTQPVDFHGVSGDTATFTIAAVGSGLSYQWQVSTNGGNTWGNSTAGGYNTASMWVNVTDSNGGYRYRCKVTDSSGNVVYSEPGEIKLARETWTFTYDADGMRTSRSSSSATYSYVYNGSQLSQMTVDGNTLYFAYDASGTPMSVAYNGTAYYYATNLQGDVTAILNTSGTAVVTYTYDAWGNILSTGGSMASSLGVHNPLRYRGYVYDTETGLYYLQSRYYNPQVGRFLNADTFVSTGQGLLGNNMFAYCRNNPVCRIDISGTADISYSTGDETPWDDMEPDGGGGGSYGYGVDFSTAMYSSLYTGGIYNTGYTMYTYYTAPSTTQTTAQCFIAGTLVKSEHGDVPLENVSVGDKVWAWDEETGDVALKSVVETYENETSELIHVFVNGEEIITTPSHPFYSPVTGWTEAVRLRAGDILVLVNGEYVVVEKIQHEILEAPITVYNFQVEDYHTYYVSDTGILVHNTCGNRGQLKKNMLSEEPAPGPEYQAHHGLPWKNRDYFDQASLNVNDAKFGRWVLGGGNGGHQSWSWRYGALWDKYIDLHPVPDAGDIVDYFNRLNGL